MSKKAQLKIMHWLPSSSNTSPSEYTEVSCLLYCFRIVEKKYVYVYILNNGKKQKFIFIMDEHRDEFLEIIAKSMNCNVTDLMMPSDKVKKIHDFIENIENKENKENKEKFVYETIIDVNDCVLYTAVHNNHFVISTKQGVYLFQI